MYMCIREIECYLKCTGNVIKFRIIKLQRFVMNPIRKRRWFQSKNNGIRSIRIFLQLHMWTQIESSSCSKDSAEFFKFLCAIMMLNGWLMVCCWRRHSVGHSRAITKEELNKYYFIARHMQVSEEIVRHSIIV